MHALRSARTLARLVLVWFALSLGVAVASPLVNPQAMELICSGSGVIKVLVKTDDGVKEQSRHMLDCPLCAATGSPPLELLSLWSRPAACSMSLSDASLISMPARSAFSI